MESSCKICHKNEWSILVIFEFMCFSFFRWTSQACNTVEFCRIEMVFTIRFLFVQGDQVIFLNTKLLQSLMCARILETCAHRTHTNAFEQRKWKRNLLASSPHHRLSIIDRHHHAYIHILFINSCDWLYKRFSISTWYGMECFAATVAAAAASITTHFNCLKKKKTITVDTCAHESSSENWWLVMQWRLAGSHCANNKKKCIDFQQMEKKSRKCASGAMK